MVSPDSRSHSSHNVHQHALGELDQSSEGWCIAEKSSACRGVWAVGVWECGSARVSGVVVGFVGVGGCGG